MTTNTNPGIGTLVAVDEDGNELCTFIKEKRLGTGGGAVVYLAQKLQPDTGDVDDEEQRSHVPKVAVKEAVPIPIWKGHLAKEARILRRLSETLGNRQRRVVKSDGIVYETAGGGESKAFIELEYLDGVTLEEWFNEEWFKGPMRSWEERLQKAAEFTFQLADALIELESVGIIHRDIKPSNLMVTNEGLRLFDFNIATEDNPELTLTKHVGTPSYQAPEVLMGRSYDRRADFFAVGLVAWAILHQGKLNIEKLNYGHDEYQVDWPSPECADIPEPEANRLRELMTGLLCDVDRRIKTPIRIKELASEILKSFRPPSNPVDVIDDLDLIQLIFELRASGQASVVADMEANDPLEEYVRDKTRVEDPLENYLVGTIRDAMNGEPEAPKLLMLSGNAGDGKSYLIDRLIRHHLVDEPKLEDRLKYIADATHSLSPSESQQDRLEEFFAPFAADTNEEPSKDLYLIAMNTGMVIRFFEQARDRWQRGAKGAHDFGPLYHTLQLQLGLKRSADSENPHVVEVVNLDLRSLVSEIGERSFVHRMLEKLDISRENGLLTSKYQKCAECSARRFCPVRFNLAAMRRDDVRSAVVRFLRRAAIEPEVHLSPRNVWDFLYRLLTGGMERYETMDEDKLAPCDLIRAKVAKGREELPWLLRGHFTEQLFESADRGSIWAALTRLDPAYTTVPKIDQFQTRLSVSGDLDTATDTILALGGEGKVLADLSLGGLLEQLPDTFSSSQRQNAAVRRHVIFEADLLEHFFEFGGFKKFDDLLDAYAVYSAEKTPSPEQQAALIELKDLVQEAIVRSYGRHIKDRFMLRVSQPNSRSSSHLLVEAKNIDQEFLVTHLVSQDIHIQAHIHDGRRKLLGHLGYRPNIVTLDIAGNRLMVDESVFDFLQRVKDGQQPSAFDLAQFQALRYIAERLGNQLARTASKLYVIEGESGDLYRLSQNEFGAYDMSLEEGA